MKKNNVAIFEIVCYVVAGLLGLYTLYMLYENIAYINETLTMYGMSFSDMSGEIIQSVLTVIVPNFTYAFLTFAAGRIYHQVALPVCICVDDELVEEEGAEEEVIVAVEPVEETEVEEPAEEAAVEAEETPAEVVEEGEEK